MKNVTEAIFYPYVQAKDHFMEAAELPWKEAVVILARGALKSIPLLNYLVILVEKAVSHFFYRPPVLPLPFKFDRVTIWLNDKLGGIQNFESADDTKWDMRVRKIRDVIKSMLGQLETAAHESRLKALSDDRNIRGKPLYDQLMAIVAELTQADEVQKGQQEEALQRELAKLEPFPTFQTFYRHVKYLEINWESFGCRRDKWANLGIQSYQDLALLQLNRFDATLFELRRLDLCQQLHSEAKPAFDTAKAVFVQQVQSALLHFKLFEPIDYDKVSKQIQRDLLGKYLLQQDHNLAWKNLHRMGIHTLSALCTNNGIADPSSLFELGMTYR